MKMKLFLALVMTIFVAILLGLIYVARLARPVMLDEHGRPVGEASAGQHHP
jgi:hypothetical protein